MSENTAFSHSNPRLGGFGFPSFFWVFFVLLVMLEEWQLRLLRQHAQESDFFRVAPGERRQVSGQCCDLPTSLYHGCAICCTPTHFTCGEELYSPDEGNGLGICVCQACALKYGSQQVLSLLFLSFSLSRFLSSVSWFFVFF